VIGSYPGTIEQFPLLLSQTYWSRGSDVVGEDVGEAVGLAVGELVIISHRKEVGSMTTQASLEPHGSVVWQFPSPWQVEGRQGLSSTQ